MATIDERAGLLEQEMAAVKAHLETHDGELVNIPELIKIEFRLTNSQIARLSRDVSQLRDLPSKIDALPRVIAQMLTEMKTERRSGDD